MVHTFLLRCLFCNDYCKCLLAKDTLAGFSFLLKTYSRFVVTCPLWMFVFWLIRDWTRCVLIAALVVTFVRMTFSLIVRMTFSSTKVGLLK